VFGRGTSTREELDAAGIRWRDTWRGPGRWVPTTRWRAQSRPPPLICCPRSTAGAYTGSLRSRGEGTPLSELELVTGALMDGGRCQNTVVRYGPEQSVLGLAVGETVQPTADGVERLARAALDELEAQFAE
jgi:hypothetical protein